MNCKQNLFKCGKNWKEVLITYQVKIQKKAELDKKNKPPQSPYNPSFITFGKN